MIEGWNKGPRKPGASSYLIHESADWVRQMGPRVAVEVLDASGAFYGTLVIGTGASAHRVELGVVVDVNARIDTEDALPQILERAEEAAGFILDCLGER